MKFHQYCPNHADVISKKALWGGGGGGLAIGLHFLRLLQGIFKFSQIFSSGCSLLINTFFDVKV